MLLPKTLLLKKSSNCGMKSYKGKKVVLFYSSVQDKKLFSIQGFYKTDITILQDLGYTVVVSNRIRDFLHFRKYDFAFLYFYQNYLVSRLFSQVELIILPEIMPAEKIISYKSIFSDSAIYSQMYH